ncbi:MAG: L-aspartate oxidase [Planctomycetota bacterium]
MRVDVHPEGRYLVGFDTRDLPRYATDTLVVGSGIAGLSAALAAAEHGRVIVMLKDPPESTNTAWAQGGVAAVVDPDDAIADHAADTIRVGAGLCDEAVVESVIGAAPEAIERLVAQGAEFDRSDGGYALAREAGHSAARVLHAQGDATGMEVIRALVEAVQKNNQIRVLDRHFMIDLLTADDRCVGALAQSDGQLVTVFARAVILAAGGAGRLFRESSNVRGATGDGIVAAYRAGAVVRDLEFVQFHPTALYLAGSQRALVTEAVRGDGAYLIDNRGHRFLPDVHEAGELAPRDVVSRAIVDHLGRPGITDVYLDMRHWPEGHAARRFPGLVRRCRTYDIDPERDPVPVRPVAHYLIGGVAVDLDGRSSVDALYACGEAACSGMHGANRLASNSLLEGLVLGHRAGRTAGLSLGDRFDGDIAHRATRWDHLEIDVEDLRKSLVSRMWRCAGVVREAGCLSSTIAAIDRWRTFMARARLFGRAGFELENMLLLGALVSSAATKRTESRGTHYREDHPERDDALSGSFHWSGGEDAVFKPRGYAVRG